jgi:hypothetical protein
MRARYPLVAAIALALALAPAGCGGDDGEESNGTGTNTSTTAEQGGQGPGASANEAPQGRGKSAEGNERNGSEKIARQDTAVGDPIPGAQEPAPGVPVTRGGDNSIQVFGVEAEASPRTQAVENLTAYLAAFEAGDWPRACALASEEYSQGLTRLIANARARDGAQKPRGCAATLEALFARANEAALRSFRVGEVLSFRIEGAYAYLIYRNVEGKAMFIAMADDDGEWKVNTIQPASFVTGGRR